MEKNNNNNSSGGVGIFTILLVIFVTLKLIPGTVVYNWSWWWVLSPIWIPLAILALIFTLAVLHYIIVKHDYTRK